MADLYCSASQLIPMWVSEWVREWVTKVSIELLWQLKVIELKPFQNSDFASLHSIKCGGLQSVHHMCFLGWGTHLFFLLMPLYVAEVHGDFSSLSILYFQPTHICKCWDCHTKYVTPNNKTNRWYNYTAQRITNQWLPLSPPWKEQLRNYSQFSEKNIV